MIKTTIEKEEINAGLTRDRYVTILSDPAAGIEVLIATPDYRRMIRAGMTDQEIIRIPG